MFVRTNWLWLSSVATVGLIYFYSSLVPIGTMTQAKHVAPPPHDVKDRTNSHQKISSEKGEASAVRQANVAPPPHDVKDRTNLSHQDMISGKREAMQKRLPGSIIIGGKKSGTTKLTKYLTANPMIKAPRYESHFFDTESLYKEGYDVYLRNLPEVTRHQVLIEKTPEYFSYEPAAGRIHAMNESIKLLLILRDPVNRIFSDYAHGKRQPNHKIVRGYTAETVPFRRIEKEYSLEHLAFSAKGGLNLTYDPVVQSMYDIHVKRYLALFPREQLLVLDGEQFIKNPLPILRQCEEFLGVPHLNWDDRLVLHKDGYYCLANEGCSDVHVHKQYPEDMVQTLRHLYLPHVRRLVDLLGQTFEWQSAYM